jgi:hypothetical protein
LVRHCLTSAHFFYDEAKRSVVRSNKYLGLPERKSLIVEIPLEVEGIVENSHPDGRRVMVMRNTDGTYQLTHWLPQPGPTNSAPKIVLQFPSIPHSAAFMRAMGWQVHWKKR